MAWHPADPFPTGQARLGAKVCSADTDPGDWDPTSSTKQVVTRVNSLA